VHVAKVHARRQTMHMIVVRSPLAYWDLSDTIMLADRTSKPVWKSRTIQVFLVEPYSWNLVPCQGSFELEL